jgi:hypothetical protein
MDKFLYVFVRTDMPVENQIVQVAHACYDAGQRFKTDEYSHTLILLAVPDEAALLKAYAKIRSKNIDLELFFEPDYPFGYNAACTAPISALQRRHFSQYFLWRQGGEYGIEGNSE